MNSYTPDIDRRPRVTVTAIRTEVMKKKTTYTTDNQTDTMILLLIIMHRGLIFTALFELYLCQLLMSFGKMN